VETAEHLVGYKPKPENRGWFDGECKTPVDEKSRMQHKNRMIDQLDPKE
jgi:hypothetical protein